MTPTFYKGLAAGFVVGILGAYAHPYIGAFVIGAVVFTFLRDWRAWE